MKLYQLYDNKAQTAAGPIMSLKNDAPAIRHFHDLLSQGKDNIVSQHPDDFQLIYLGEQNDDTAQITPMTPPQTVTTGTAWRQHQEPDDEGQGYSFEQNPRVMRTQR